MAEKLTRRELTLDNIYYRRVLPVGMRVQDSLHNGYTVVHVNIHRLWTPLLKRLRGQKDQFWYHVCRRCTSEYVKNKLERPVMVVLDTGDRKAWDARRWPEGAGAEEGSSVDSLYKYLPTATDFFESEVYDGRN